MKKIIFSGAALIIAATVFLAPAQPVFTQSLSGDSEKKSPPSLLSDSKEESTSYSSGCISDGDCELNDFVVLAVRVSQIMLGLTGSLSLLALIYGGILFLISAGNTEQVAKGKKTIFYALIGIIVVLASYTVITFVYKSFGLQDNPLKPF